MSFDEAKQAGLQRATIPRLHDGGARSLLALTDPSSTLLYRSSTLWVIRASMVGGDGSVVGKDNRTSQARFPLLNLAGAAQTQTKSIRRDPAAAPADRERDASDTIDRVRYCRIEFPVLTRRRGYVSPGSQSLAGSPRTYNNTVLRVVVRGRGGDISQSVRLRMRRHKVPAAAAFLRPRNGCWRGERSPRVYHVNYRVPLCCGERSPPVVRIPVRCLAASWDRSRPGGVFNVQ